MESVASSVPKDVQQQVYYMFGVAYLRDAETVNCVHCINGERCLFPITGQGVHGTSRAVAMRSSTLPKLSR